MDCCWDWQSMACSQRVKHVVTQFAPQGLGCLTAWRGGISNSKKCNCMPPKWHEVGNSNSVWKFMDKATPVMICQGWWNHQPLTTLKQGRKFLNILLESWLFLLDASTVATLRSWVVTSTFLQCGCEVWVSLVTVFFAGEEWLFLSSTVTCRLNAMAHLTCHGDC